MNYLDLFYFFVGYGKIPWSDFSVPINQLAEVLLLSKYNTRLVVLSTLFLGVASGLIGSFLLLRKRSLMGDALSHATFPGIGIAFLIMVSFGYSGKSLIGLLIGATITGVIGIIIMLLIRNTSKLKDDVAMGFVLSVSFGLGVVILRFIQDMPQGSKAGLESFIYGRTASMILSDFFFIGSVAIICIFICFLFLKEFTLLCFDEDYCKSQGWSVVFLDILLLALVTIVTVIGLQSVGLILIIAFLIIPASTARFWTNKISKMIILASLFGGISGWLGSSISALLPKLPAGAIIVLVSSFLFTLSMIFAPERGVLFKYIENFKLKIKVNSQHILRASYEIIESKSKDNSIVINREFKKSTILKKRTWRPKLLNKILKRETKNGHFVKLKSKKLLQLSESGFGEASRITRNHRLWEIYLVTYADIAPSHVDRDADMIEHVLDEKLVRKLEDKLQDEGIWLPIASSLHDLKPSSHKGI